MIIDAKGKTPRFVLVDDPDGGHEGDRLMLNQFSGETAHCNLNSEHSMRLACREIDERKNT